MPPVNMPIKTPALIDWMWLQKPITVRLSLRSTTILHTVLAMLEDLNSALMVKKQRHSKFYFDNTLVVIEIENTFFNVHKYQLMKSETFTDMFKAANKDPEEGSSDDKPIVLEGVKASDFESLLTVLYATRFSNYQPAPDASLIIPAFRLANKWNFKDLRTFLLPLAEKELDDIDKIVFAREFDIQEWLAPAHIRLCQRKDAFTTEEAQKLGIDSLLFVYRTREEHYRMPFPPNDEPTPDEPQLICGSCIGYSLHSTSASAYNCSYCGSRTRCFTRNSNDDSSVDSKVKEWVKNGCKIFPSNA